VVLHRTVLALYPPKHPSQQLAQQCAELAAKAARLHLADGRSDAELAHPDCRVRPGWTHELWHHLANSLQMHVLELVVALNRDGALGEEE